MAHRGRVLSRHPIDDSVLDLFERALGVRLGLVLFPHVALHYALDGVVDCIPSHILDSTSYQLVYIFNLSPVLF